MQLKHLHVKVRDLHGAKDWLAEVLEMQPAFTLPTLAYYKFGDITVVFDQATDDADVTLAVHVDDCDDAFRRLTARGAVALSEPATQKWGVRSAYLQGPGGAVLELEQAL
jgi:hypothetical protein